jgi:signal transduction histidine kinase
LLESSIIDAGLLRLEPQPVELPRLAKNVTDDIARRTKIHRFLLDFPERFPILDADPDRIVQVLRNLLDNAVKYSPEGGLIVVRGEVREDEVVVSVADQGVGLNPEHLNRLFEKFFRARSSLGRHVVGSGLGLPISRTIVESHGGRIWAESQVGQGTTLFFALPLEGLSQGLAAREEGWHE